MESENRLIRRVKINQFLDNYGVFNWSIFYISWTATFISFLSISLTLLYIFELRTLDFYIVTGAVEKDLIYFYNYIMTNVIGSLNSFNYINNLVGFRMFSFNINTSTLPPISFEGYILLLISVILTFKVYILSIYQFYIQRKIRNMGFMNYFVPYIFLFKFLKRKKTRFIYIKLLDTLKLEPFNPQNKAIKNIILQLFFEIETKELEQYTIQIEAKSMFKGWYNYQIWTVIEDEKYKQQQEKLNKTDNKQQQENKNEPDNSQRTKRKTRRQKQQS